jgi:ribosomal protein S18 acetylase RimI-like enzyme
MVADSTHATGSSTIIERLPDIVQRFFEHYGRDRLLWRPPSMQLIREARSDDLPALARLFEAYRQFYQLPADAATSAGYMEARLVAQDSVLLVAADERGTLTGFCQLYPSWCSLLAAPIYILYDLYVAAPNRRDGIGRALLQAAADRARRDGKARMDLATAKSNVSAQSLYESLGWERDEEFLTYTLTLR